MAERRLAILAGDFNKNPVVLKIVPERFQILRLAEPFDGVGNGHLENVQERFHKAFFD
jgi:hypothetical protein